VDDTTALLTLYQAILEDAFSGQFDIVTSMNAVTAIHYLTTVDEKDILCVITDYEMLEMDGHDFSTKIREIWANVPIFLHSNTHIEFLPEIREQTKHLNITVLSKENSLKSVIMPWILSQVVKI